MNFNLENIPERTTKKRDSGITMVMDKGLSVRQIKDFLSVAEPYIDIVKLGFGTSHVVSNLRKKLKLYKDADVPAYFGGTLYEAFVIRGQFKDYVQAIKDYNMEYVEVSDGSIDISHEEKCEHIEELSKHVTVLSEIGSKDLDAIIPPYRWIELMKEEIEAGSWKLIAEARESGNVGIYRESGEVRMGLVDEILTQIPEERIIWEAPQKAQQVWFIDLIGANVNLGNIAPDEVIPLETLRLGLRGDTFTFFLNEKQLSNYTSG
jgi:phosphosulfolactate synthase